MPEGRLADNIVYFARALRKAGMRVGPASVKDAIEAVLVAGIGSRDDFYWTLHAVLVTAARGPCRLRRGVPAVLAVARADREDAGDVLAGGAATIARSRSRAPPKTRVADAMFEGHRKEQQGAAEMPEIEVDARFTFSGKEVLRGKDFAQMTAAELGGGQSRRSPSSRLPFDLVRDPPLPRRPARATAPIRAP